MDLRVPSKVIIKHFILTTTTTTTTKQEQQTPPKTSSQILHHHQGNWFLNMIPLKGFLPIDPNLSL